MEEKDRKLTDEIREQQDQEEKEASSVNQIDESSSANSGDQEDQDETPQDTANENPEKESDSAGDAADNKGPVQPVAEEGASKEEESDPEELRSEEATEQSEEPTKKAEEPDETAPSEQPVSETEDEPDSADEDTIEKQSTVADHSQTPESHDNEGDETKEEQSPVPTEETSTSVESEIAEEPSEQTSAEDEKVVETKSSAETSESVESKSEDSIPDEPQSSEHEEAPQSASEETPINDQPQAEDEQEQDSEATQEVTSETEEHAEESHSDEEHAEVEEHHLDYSNYNKKQMVQVLESQLKNPDYDKIGQILNEIKPAYDDVIQTERQEAYEKYLEEGGEKDGFEYRYDDLDNRFLEAYNALKDKRSEYFNSIEKRKEQNLEKKQDLLEQLRKMVDADETVTSMKELKDIQEEWKNSGPVPPQHVKSLWANYNALIDRFYDQRSIYFELKELDRKKNLELKLELCERAEKLEEVENIKEAIKILNELHDEFKHIGPIPKEEQEPVWLRFKAASDAVYSRRKQYFEGLKEQLKLNQQAKEALAERVQAFSEFDSEKISDWNAKTKEILELQREWESIGGLPRENAKKINKTFWGAFKSFFNHKGKFFKKIEAQRHENMKLKEELVAKAEELKDSEDLMKTAQTLKDLQRDWKEIGPVPEKFRNEIYGRFKAACDHFFNRKRAAESEQEKDYFENLKEKQAICEDIEQMADNDDVDLDKIDDYLEQWGDIGFVPKANIKSIQARFTKAVVNAVEKTDLDEDEKQRMKFSAQFSKLKNSPNSKRILQKKENSLRRQIAKLENDIVLWKNNISFFTSDSKESEKLKEEFNEKIEKASQELESLEEQLRAIHSI